MIRGRKFEEKRPERRVFGFLEAASFASPRADFVFDAVDAQAFEDGIAQDRSPEHLSIIRIMTTTRRLQELFKTDVPLLEGDWFELTLAPFLGNPPAWIVDAVDDYMAAPTRTNIVSLTRLGEGASPSPGPLTALRGWCVIAGVEHPKRRHVRQTKDFFVRILDIGQANCSAIHIDRDKKSLIVGYYDVGSPIFFHKKTVPKGFSKNFPPPAVGNSNAVALGF